MALVESSRRRFLATAVCSTALRASPEPALVIPMRDRAGIELRAPFTRLVKDNELAALRNEAEIIPGVWPGLPRANASAGPSGLPWLDSNAGRIAAARARTSKPVWVAFAAPRRVLSESDYLVAIADCESSGARWIADLAPDAVAPCARAIQFFLQHTRWRQWPSAGAIGVLGTNEDSCEIMNLLFRRHLPFRIVTHGQFGELRCLIAFDEPALAPRRQQIASWVRSGGALITNQKGFESLGARVITWKEEVVDPYLVASHAKRLLGKDGEPIRVYNMFTSNLRFTESADHQHALVEFVNFTGRALPDETNVWLRRRYAKAWLHTFATSRALPVQAAADGTEITIPEREVYAALELVA